MEKERGSEEKGAGGNKGAGEDDRERDAKARSVNC